MNAHSPSPAPRRRPLRTLLLSVLTALALVPTAVLATASPAAAATSQFRGMNWAVLGDNFSTGPLVVQGLSQSDSNATVRAKANALYDDMASTMGVNTVRLPINTHTVGHDLVERLPRRHRRRHRPWIQGHPRLLGGRRRLRRQDHEPRRVEHDVVHRDQHRTARTANVYFEPMNEPHGYSSAEWRNVAANWLSYHSSAVPGRVLIGGTGFSQDLRDICNDSRFNSTLLSFHHYAFFYGAMTYDAFRSHIRPAWATAPPARSRPSSARR